jgi:hypothetical protein
MSLLQSTLFKQSDIVSTDDRSVYSHPLIFPSWGACLGLIEKGEQEERLIKKKLSRSPHRVHIFTRDETGSVYLPAQLELTLQLYW